MTSYMKPVVDFHRTRVVDYRYVLENTIQPFAPGDIFLGCTFLNDPVDDHAGLGRILQYDADFKPKGVLWTKGHRHLVMGLTFDAEGVLWGFDIHTQDVLRIDRYGRQMPAHRFAHRAFGAAAFGADGSIYFGETLKGSRALLGLADEVRAGHRPDRLRQDREVRSRIPPGRGVPGRDGPGAFRVQGGHPPVAAPVAAVHRLHDRDQQAPDALRHREPAPDARPRSHRR